MCLNSLPFLKQLGCILYSGAWHVNLELFLLPLVYSSLGGETACAGARGVCEFMEKRILTESLDTRSISA